VAVGVALFLVWSNSFVAASFLLGGERGAARFDAVSLSIARFVPVVPFCLGWVLLVRRRQAIALLRRFPVRAPIAGLLSVPAYNLALYSGQQRGVPAPVASLTTALMPFAVMLLAALFLGEPLSWRKGGAFALALSGLALIATSRGGGAAGGGPSSAREYAALLALTALAPLSWAIYSILSKPVAGVASPLDWTFLTLALGGLPLMAALPFRGAREMAALDAAGWGALLFLSVLCTIVGYAVWSWLLRHLPASSVGFFSFLNPPLTALSKYLLALAMPAAFVWTLVPLELAGAGLALAGLALVLLPVAGSREPPAPVPAPEA
jgi:O-acetylserine/cysteine efflux transporter